MQYYLSLDTRTPGFDASFESSAFAHASKELEAIERQLGIKSHFELFSYAAQNSMCPPEHRETKIPWFDAQEGIDWLAAVIDFIHQNPSSIHESEQLANDFIDCQNILRKAKDIGAKWHFEMDI